MSAVLLLAQGIGSLLASIVRARGNGGAADLIESTQQLADSVTAQVEAHIAAGKVTGVSVEEFRAKVDAAKQTALLAGDEAQARIDARADQA